MVKKRRRHTAARKFQTGPEALAGCKAVVGQVSIE